MKRTRIVVAVALAVYALVIMLTVSDSGTAHAPSSGGKLVFSDNFQRAEVGPRYFVGEPDKGYKNAGWRIQDGRLVAMNIHNAALWLKAPLPDKVRIEFDGRAETDDGDVKCEVFGDGQRHQSGYILIFGGWKNRVTCIARLDEHSEERKLDNRCPTRGRKRVCVEPGVNYSWVIERVDGTVRWYLNGLLHLTYPDNEPLTGRFFAFNNWEAKVTFDNLKIFDLSLDE